MVSEETNHGDPLILGFQPPELWEIKSLLFKPHSVWSFVARALADCYIYLLESDVFHPSFYPEQLFSRRWKYSISKETVQACSLIHQEQA